MLHPTQLDVMISDIRLLEDPADPTLRLQLDSLRESTKLCSVNADSTKRAFRAWAAGLEQLGFALSHGHNTQPPPLSPWTPPVPSGDNSDEALAWAKASGLWAVKSYDMDSSDQFWRDLPEIEACIRRWYRALTSGPGGALDRTRLLSPAGLRYVGILGKRLRAFERMSYLAGCSNTQETTQVLQGIKITRAVGYTPDVYARWIH